MTSQLLKRLRFLMKDKNFLLQEEPLKAYIIPSSDSHGSRYNYNKKDKRLAFITKFTGLLIFVIVTIA